MKLFEKTFEVVEIHSNGVSITHYLKGKKHDIKKAVDVFKKKSKRHEMIGKKGLIIWV